jgi:hypothetical protein
MRRAPFLRSESELVDDDSFEDEGSWLDSRATGKPFKLDVVTNLFLACEEARHKYLAQLGGRESTHLEQDLALELGRARQLLHLALHLVHPLRYQPLSEGRLHDLDELVLLLDSAVDLHAEEDGIRRGEESVLSDGVEDLANGDLGGESEAVSNDWKTVVAIPYVDCEERSVSSALTRAVVGTPSNARSTQRQPC